MTTETETNTLSPADLVSLHVLETAHCRSWAQNSTCPNDPVWLAVTRCCKTSAPLCDPCKVELEKFDDYEYNDACGFAWRCGVCGTEPWQGTDYHTA